MTADKVTYIMLSWLRPPPPPASPVVLDSDGFDVAMTDVREAEEADLPADWKLVGVTNIVDWTIASVVDVVCDKALEAVGEDARSLLNKLGAMMA